MVADLLHIHNLLERVTDPEIPVLTIDDLGVLRKIEEDNGKIIVTITPTYSGCPAIRSIEQEIVQILHDSGFEDVEVKTVLSPAWTTDWLSEEGKRKLEKYGIAPPVNSSADKGLLMGSEREIRCPRCKSFHTEMKSQFGSTACKALYICKECGEPFDYFKCL